MPTIVGILSFICMINIVDRSAHLRSQTSVNRCLEGIAYILCTISLAVSHVSHLFVLKGDGATLMITIFYMKEY